MSVKPAFLTLDTLSDRRDIWHLLHRLPPHQRVAFLVECCRRVASANGNGPKPLPSMWSVMIPDAVRCDRGDVRLTNSCYTDIVALSSQYDLDLVRVAIDLERVVRSVH